MMQFLKMMAKEKFEQLVTVDTNGTFFLDTMHFAKVPRLLYKEG